MTPTKETLDVPNSATEAAVAPANIRATNDAARMRSDAVSLDVPVKVHGTRMKDTKPNATGEPFEENTSSMIVFPQGGVLKMASPVAAGQMMVVTNLKSGHDAICRVVKVRAYAQGQSYVEIEFTHRQPGYWGVYFPSDRDQSSALNPPAPPAPAPTISAPAASDAKDDKPQRPAPDQARMAASTVKVPAKPSSRPESAFAPIGSQEEIQPAAALTSTRIKQQLAPEPQSANSSIETPTKSALDDLPLAPASSSPSLSMDELQGDSSAPPISFAGAGVPGEVAEAPLAEEPRSAEESTPTFGRFAATASLSGERASAREPFAGAFGSGSLSISGDQAPHGKRGHGLAVAASIIAIVAAAGAAAYYMHLLPLATKQVPQFSAAASPATAPVLPPPSSEPAPATQAAIAATSNAAPVSPNGSTTAASPVASEPVMASTPPAAASRSSASQPAPVKTKKPAPAATIPPPVTASSAALQKPAAKVPDMFGAMNAHPTARTYSGESAAAPDVSVGQPGDAALPAISAPVAIAAPSPVQQGPVRIRVGGAIKPPRLLSSVVPVYPQMARETGIEGAVVIDAAIDKAGNVTSAKVVSGPPMLRQAALDAMRQWKYEPSRLNGEPVPVQMTVTINFHRQ